MMDEITILAKYKNSLLSTIQESGFNPNLFISKEEFIDKNKYFVISIHNSKIIFAVRPYSESFDSFYCLYSRFDAKFSKTSNYAVGFDSLAIIFKEK